MLFRKMMKKGKAAFRERYPWFRSGSYKVASYRGSLDRIAEQLSEMQLRTVKTRFNRARQCAEIYTGDSVLASVRVYGGVYFGGDMRVEGKLSPAEEILFKKATRLQVNFHPA